MRYRGASAPGAATPDGDVEEQVALSVFTFADLEVARGEFRPFGLYGCPQFAAQRGNGHSATTRLRPPAFAE